MKNECFNRTFMELKAGTNQGYLAGKGFQSHLYGIERAIKITVKNRHDEFQSHLYGIESC